MPIAYAFVLRLMSRVANCNRFFAQSRGLSSLLASGIVFAVFLFGGGTLIAQQGTSVSDPDFPLIIVPSKSINQVFVLNADATVTGFATSTPASYTLRCAAPTGLAVAGAASQTLAIDDFNRAVFQTGAGSSSPSVVGTGIPYNGSNCISGPPVVVGTNAAAAVLSAADTNHKYLYIVATGTQGKPDTISSYSTSAVSYGGSANALQPLGKANLDTGGTYTAVVTDEVGNYGLTFVTEVRTSTSTGGTWLFNNTFGTATKLLGPGGVDLPAVNAFIIHNPNDGGGNLLVLVNQDGLTAANLTNPPLDTTPFTIIDIGQLNDLLNSLNNPKTLTLPSVTTIASSLSYYAMLGAVFNPGDQKIYAVVGGGTSLANVSRSLVRYDPSKPAAPAETVVNDVSIVPLTSAQNTQLAVNGASGSIQILAKDLNRVFTAGIGTGGAAATELFGSTFGDNNFIPTYLASNPLLGETYIASAATVDILTKPAANKMQAYLDMTSPELQTNVGSGYVNLLGEFPDISDKALATTNITITATPQGGGAAFIFATLTASSTLTLPRYVSGTFPSAGIYTLVANFPGDAQYSLATSAPVIIAVGQALYKTTTTATATFNGATGAGAASVTLSGTTYAPSGTIAVTSVNTGTVLATYYLVNGYANPISIPFMAPTSTTAITLTFSGDTKNQSSTTGSVSLKSVALVTPVISAMVPATGVVNTSVSIPISFTSTTTNVPTGTITIFATSQTISYALVGKVSASSAFATGGTAINWITSIPDSFSIYASYAGDSSYNPVSSTQIGSIVIGGGKYSFALSSPTTSAAGTPFNVIVNASSGATATGNVTITAFKLGTNTPVTLGTVNAAAATGGATLVATIPSSGVYFLNGSYAGDANYPASSSANSPTVNVTAGTTPTVTLTPAAVSLTSVVNTSVQRSFLLFNTGGTSLNISSIAVSGAGFSQFNGCPNSLQSGTNCTINVVFAPMAIGTVTGLLSIVDNATGSPHTSTLTGIATASSVTVSPSNVTFIDQSIGTGSFLRPQVALINSGSSAFSITSVTLSSTPDFEITTNPCGSVGSLQPGGSCTVSLEFHPTTAGAKTATLTFTTSNSTGPLSATLTGNGLSGNPATPPNCVDSDGDGLCDDWETNGVWVRISPTLEKFIDLPSMGANPLHKDIFVQADYMETAYVPTGDHSHQMTANAAYSELLGFDQSPVSNPDGTTGIHLHVDCGPTCIMILNGKKTWGARSRASGMMEQSLLDTIHTGEGIAFDWTKYDQASSVFLASGRNLIFHHAIMAHMQNAANTSSGLSRNGSNFNLGASDLIVSFGGWPSVVGTDPEQAGTLMHELGHNLGLHHGGDLDDNYKPNYLSIMNYHFQTGGVIFDNGKGPGNGFFDYSRFLLPALDETKLNEVNGINANATTFIGAKNLSISSYGTLRFCDGDKSKTSTPQIVNYVNGNVNWNCNTIGTTVPATPYIDKTLVGQDINADGGRNVSVNGLVYPLTSFNDWPALVYSGGSISGNGIGQAPAATTQANEITQDQDSLIPKLYMVALKTMGRVHSAPNSKMTLNVVVANTGITDDTYLLSASTLGGWAINSSLPASVTVPARGTATVSLTYTVPANANNGDMDTLLITAQSQKDDFISDTKEVGIYAATTPFPDSLSTAQIVFGSQVLGGTSASGTVTILNTGSANLGFGAVTTTAEFAQTNTCGSTLAIGASCVVSVTFTPSAAGARTGTLTIDDGTGTAKVLAMTGTGVPPSLPFPSITLSTNTAVTSTGQTVTFSLHVAGATSAVPTGTITISNGTTQIGQLTLDASGTGTFSTSALAAGMYSFIATYSGDSAFRSTTSPPTALTVVTVGPTTMALTTSAATVATGANVTFTVTIGGGTTTLYPTGNVTFLDGTTTLGTGVLNASGVATFATTTLTAGTHTITAKYGGDNVFGGAVSTPVTVIVGLFATTNTLTASATTVTTGISVTLTSTLTSTGGTPTGTVIFLDGTTTLGTGTLNSAGISTLSATALTIGTHNITAQYAATGNFGASISSALQIVVSGVPDYSISASPTSLSVTSGSSAIAVFTVTPVNGYTGILSFSCGALPTHASCTFVPSKLTFTSAAQTGQFTTLTFATNQSTGLLRPLFPEFGATSVCLALGLPLGLLTLGWGRQGRKSRKLRRIYLMLAFFVLAGVAVLSGCSGNSGATSTAAGTYIVPITVTDGTTSHTVSYSVIVK